jgi:hypothetical protein
MLLQKVNRPRYALLGKETSHDRRCRRCWLVRPVLGRGHNAHFKSIKFIPNKFLLLCRPLHLGPQCIVNYSDLWPPGVLSQGSYVIPYFFSWSLFFSVCGANKAHDQNYHCLYFHNTGIFSEQQGQARKDFSFIPPPYFWRKPGMFRGAREMCSPDSHLSCPRNMPLRTCNTMIASVSAHTTHTHTPTMCILLSE